MDGNPDEEIIFSDLREVETAHLHVSGDKRLSDVLISSQPSLESITLCCTTFIKDDLQHLSQITRINEFPKLEILDLSWSTLNGCLSDFLPDPHTGLPPLQVIDLRHAKLNEEDLQHLVYLIKTQKLPGLTELRISRCDTSEDMLKYFGELADVCKSATITLTF